MTRTEILRTRLAALAVCFLLLLDLFGNLLLSVVLLVWAVATKQEGAAPTAFEPMSARAGRAWLNRKAWAGLTVPLVDRLFRRQRPVVELPGGRIFAHPSHCVRAFVKLKEGAYLPREYHGPLPPSIERCYGFTPPQPTKEVPQ